MSMSQAVMSPSQELSQNLIYSTILDVLDQPKSLLNQTKEEAKNTSYTIEEIKYELKMILLTYLQLDLTKTATYFASPESLLYSSHFTSKQKRSLRKYRAPKITDDESIMDWSTRHLYDLSPEEQIKLAGHINRKIFTYLLIRSNITHIFSANSLIRFQEILIRIKEKGFNLGGRGLAFSNNMGKTIDNLLAYLHKIKGSIIKLKTTENVLNISEGALEYYLQNQIRYLTFNSTRLYIDSHNHLIAERMQILRIIDKLIEQNKIFADHVKFIEMLITNNIKNAKEINLVFEEIMKIKFANLYKPFAEKNNVTFPTNIPQEIDLLDRHIIKTGDMLANRKEDKEHLNKRKKELVDRINANEVELSLLNEKQKKLTDDLRIYLESCTLLLNHITVSRKNINPIISTLCDDGLHSDFLRDFIKNILTEIYNNRLTRDCLIPIIEGYTRETQMALLLSIASLIGPGINFFTNPSLINLTLSYLIEGTLTRDAISDKEIVSSLSLFSPASAATGTRAATIAEEKSQPTHGLSL